MKTIFQALVVVAMFAAAGCTKTTESVGGSSGGPSTPGSPSTPSGQPTVTTPNTQFIASQDYTANGNGTYWTQQFTVNTPTRFVFRFTSQFQAQASIILPDQLSKFQSKQGFSGYASFNNQVGTNFITLNPGIYYVAIRNSSTGTNKWSMELDNAISLPASDKATFVDYYFSGAKSVTAGTRLWQPFTIQQGYRYFLDGCNVNCDVRIIPANQLNAFQAGQTFQYYADYYSANGAAPGLIEIKLSIGDYYLVSYNSFSGAITYTMERWKVN